MSQTPRLFTLIQTKLHRPAVPGDLVSRAWLLDLLSQNLPRPLTVVAAGAGYGKTTLVAHWLQQLDQPSAWLSLDEHDHDLTSFLNYFVAALQTLFPSRGQETLTLLQGEKRPPAHALAATLSNELNEIAQPFTLVVDDYHMVHDLAVHDMLNELLQHPPATLHLVLITRIDPPLNLTMLMARNRALILRQQELRFLPAEAIAFLRLGTGRVFSGDEAAHLVARADGWVAGLRLLRIARRQSTPIDNEPLRLPGERPAIDYLFGEALRQQPDEVQDFLLHSAILDRFCAPLLDVVCAHDRQTGEYPLTGERLIEWLWRANVFIAPQDEEGRWFKYHALFRDLLLQELKRRHPVEAINLLHRQASAWLCREGLIEEAIHHALQAGDTTSAARLLANHRHNLIDQQQFAQLERLLKIFDPAQIEQSAELSIIDAWLKMNNGYLPRLVPILDRVESLLAGSTLPPDIVQSIQGEVCAFRAHVSSAAYYNGAETIRLTEQALQLLPRHWHYVYAVTIILNAIGHSMIGKSRLAVERLQQALADPQLTTPPISLAWLYYGLIQYHWAELDLPQMSVVAAQYLALGQTFHLAEPQAFAQLFLGIIHYHSNDLAAARQCFSAAASTAAIINLHIQSQAICGLALTYLAQGQLEEAHDLLTRHQAIALDRQNVRIMGLFQACQIEIALAQGKLAEANRWAQAYDPGLVVGLRFFYLPQRTLIKVLLAQNTPAGCEQAGALLARLADLVRQAHLKSTQLSILILQARLADQQGDEAAALRLLAEAVQLAEPSGLLRVFVDQGTPVTRLLIKLSQRGVAPEFIAQILAAFPSVPPSPRTIGQAKLIEPLTERELEILTLLDQRLSNKEIARQLFISTSTAKRHTINIYQKLQVNNRQQAADKARSLGILV